MDCREIIRREFRKKKSRDTYYSVQRFAQDLDVTPFQMNNIFLGKGRLPRRIALNIAWSFGLKGFDARRFSFSLSP
jgi:plasmid maintenance system antidote protein VapI